MIFFCCLSVPFNENNDAHPTSSSDVYWHKETGEVSLLLLNPAVNNSAASNVISSEYLRFKDVIYLSKATYANYSLSTTRGYSNSITYDVLRTIDEIAAQGDNVYASEKDLIKTAEEAKVTERRKEKTDEEKAEEEWVKSEILMAMGLIDSRKQAVSARTESKSKAESNLRSLLMMLETNSTSTISNAWIAALHSLSLIEQQSKVNESDSSAATSDSIHSQSLNDIKVVDMQRWHARRMLTIQSIKRRKIIDDVWQTVDSSSQNIFLYTAFYDDRSDLPSPALRIIAVAEVGSTNELYCLLFNDALKYPEVSRVEAISVGTKTFVDDYGLYEEFLLSCNDTMTAKNLRPSHLSIVTFTNRHPINLIVIEALGKPESTQPAVDFGICMSVIYWSHDPLRLVEWFELHRLWGVGEVSVYATKISSSVRKVMLYYSKLGFVKFRELPVIFDSSSEAAILVNMSPVINDCMYRNMYRYRTILTTDVDELIVPRVHDDYRSMMRSLNIVRRLSQSHPAPSFMFRNVYFFTDFAKNSTNSSVVANRPRLLSFLSVTKRIKPSAFGYSAKSFTNPLTCIGLQNHLCWKRIPRYDSKGWLISVPHYVAMNQHYKQCHFDNYLHRTGACQLMMRYHEDDNTLDRFRSKLQHYKASAIAHLGWHKF